MAVASKTWAVGEVVTAANKNTYERDNFSDLQSNKVVFKSGTYTGDGTTGNTITGVGFTPKFLILTAVKAGGAASYFYLTSDELLADDANGGAILSDNGGAVTYYARYVKSFNADGFTVDDAGTNADPNASAVNYHYIAWGAE